MTSLATQPLANNIKRLSARALIADFELDPQQPFLNDHRPGGHPLLGTVMGIELMSKAALALSGSAHILSMSEVQILEPLIFPDASQRRMHVRATLHAADANDTRIDCQAFSIGSNGGEVLHFKARLQPGSTYTAGPTVTIPDVSAAREVTAADVYQVFFHGPVYRVIDSIRWTPQATLAKLHRDLPSAYSPAEATTVAAPRIIEFGLQTAGLMTIAELGTNRIPHHIERIERCSAVDVYDAHAWLSITTRRRNDVDVLDVVVSDLNGRVQLRIEGYHTVPLPFPEDKNAVHALQQKLKTRV